jgi:hypothetical protein
MSLADDLVDSFAPWLTADLEDYLRSIGTMFQEVELLTGMGDEDFAYMELLDPDSTPEQALAWLAQWVGERLPKGISVPLQREWINDRPNSIRGTPESIFKAAQRTLTGTRLVSLRPRTKIDGTTHVDYITVHTLISQTPNPAAVYADLRKNLVPADIVLHYSAIVGETWADVHAANATWTLVRSNLHTWDQVYTTLSGESTFTRPVPT